MTSNAWYSEAVSCTCQLGIFNGVCTYQFAPNLTGIAENLFVSGAMQKAVIDVNESGVSAAAATVIGAGASAAPEKIATVTADRPYLNMIVDRGTNLPLFIGTTLHVE